MPSLSSYNGSVSITYQGSSCTGKEISRTYTITGNACPSYVQNSTCTTQTDGSTGVKLFCIGNEPVSFAVSLHNVSFVGTGVLMVLIVLLLL